MTDLRPGTGQKGKIRSGKPDDLRIQLIRIHALPRAEITHHRPHSQPQARDIVKMEFRGLQHPADRRVRGIIRQRDMGAVIQIADAVNGRAVHKKSESGRLVINTADPVIIAPFVHILSAGQRLQ